MKMPMTLTPQDLRQQAQVFKALGHPARLQMVMAVTAGEQCVCELTELVGLDMSTISKHLSVLTAAGVLVSDKRANKVFYRLRTPCVTQVFACLRDVQAAATMEPSACCR
jgi:DNA-binding transcriptional ArsR family regulator